MGAVSSTTMQNTTTAQNAEAPLCRERKRRNPLRTWPGRIALALLIVVALVLALRRPLLRHIGGWLYTTEEAAPSDVIIVLGGESGHRILKAIELFRAGYAPRIAITGGEAEFPEIEDTPYQRWLYLLERRGIPETAVDLLSPSNSTYDDAMLSRRYLESHGFRSALVVTGPYHTRRARWVFGRMNDDRRWEIRVIACEQPWFAPQRWWRDEEQFLWVSNEYMKLAYYVWAYGLSGPLKEPAEPSPDAQSRAGGPE